MADTRVSGGATALAERPAADGAFADEFSLDVRVVVAAHPNGKLACSTSDGCGSSCSGSACTSFTDDPV
ncbi:FxLD family lanthipeptide [Peterkaempfera bronchialis]|uniref:FxLD family lantipeptide n=1 Tax=Peterkaempfera bronchialis TaxID=2126346 RepID=A0A345SUR4_9ACTN|nr:FxLD family lanthipeptide [Peterkaempfera bronchialis]AXI77469.1 FxLD family lantipeptide [Peterkaempfera bronchialis]